MNNKQNEMNHHPLVTMERGDHNALLCFNPLAPLGALGFEMFVHATPKMQWIEILQNVSRFGVKWHLDDSGLYVHNAPIKTAPMIALQIVKIAAPSFHNLPAFKRVHSSWSKFREDEKFPDIAWLGPNGKLNHGVDYNVMMQEASRWLHEQGFLEVSQYEESIYRSPFFQ